MENVPNTFPDLFVGYAVLWSVIAFYVWSLGLRLKALQRALEDKKNEQQ